jgi:hypothetical protein
LAVVALVCSMEVPYGICTSTSTSGRSEVGKNCFLTRLMPRIATTNVAITVPATHHLRAMTRVSTRRKRL